VSDTKRYGVIPSETQTLPCSLWAVLQPDAKLLACYRAYAGYTPILFATRNEAHVEARRREEQNPARRMRVVRVRLDRA
jgi:hypothetical protein